MAPRRKLRLYIRRARAAAQRRSAHAPLARSAETDAQELGDETALRTSLSDPARMRQEDLESAQHAYGNQFVQRLARGLKVSGTRAAPNKPKSDRQVARSGEGEAMVAPEIEERVERTRGAGKPLPHDTRANMEESFGADFAGVQVHTGAESDQLNRSLNARAFTTGSDIFFAEQEYQPDTSSGQELLAHELTHVVQQGGAQPKKGQAQLAEDDEPGEMPSALPLMREVDTEELDEEKQEQLDEEQAQDASKKAEAGAEQVGQQAAKKKDAEQEVGKEAEKQEEKEKAAGDAPPASEKKTDKSADALEDAEEVAPESIDPVPDEGEAAEDQEAAADQAVATGNEMGWDSVKPADWDAELVSHDLFTTGDIADADAEYPLDATAAGDPPPAWFLEVPSTGDKVGDTVISGVMSFTGAGAALKAINNIGALTTETNPFGVMARLMEIVVNITEVITAIIGVISILVTVATILCAILSFLLNSIGSALMGTVVLAPVGAAMVSAGGSIAAFSGSVLTPTSTFLTKLTLALTLFRIQLRLIVMFLRALDIAYEAAAGADAETLRKKGWMVADQAFGLATDLVTAASSAVSLKIGGMNQGLKANELANAKMTASGAAFAGMATRTAGQKAGQVGLSVLNAAVAGGIKGGIAAGKWGAETGGDRKRREAQERYQEGTLTQSPGDLIRTAAQGLPEPPREVPGNVNKKAADYVALEIEKQTLQQRVGEVDQAAVAKQQHSASLEAGVAAADNYGGVMATQNREMDAQQDAAEEFSGKAQEGGEHGATGKEHAGLLGGMMALFQPMTASAMEGAKEQQDKGSSTAKGRVPEQQEAPKAKDSGKASEKSGQMTQVAQDAPGVLAEGKSMGERSKQETQAVQERTVAATEETAAAKDVAQDRIAQNQEDIGLLKEDRESAVDRLKEIAAEQETLKQEHEAEVKKAEAWTTEHKSAREARGLPVLTENVEDVEVEMLLPPE